MLTLVAVLPESPGRVERIRRRESRGIFVRLGGDPSDDVVLDGAGGDALEAVCDGSAWYAAAKGRTLAPLEDGSVFAVGAWRVLALLSTSDAREDHDGAARLADALASLASEDDLPRLERDGRSPLLVHDDCAVVIEGDEAESRAVAIVERRRATGLTSIYPLAGAVSVSGRALRLPGRIEHGCRVGVGGTTLRFVDPYEELDRLLGEIRGESASPSRPATAPIRPEGWRTTLARFDPRADGASVSAWEASLWIAGLAVVAAYLGLASLRF